MSNVVTSSTNPMRALVAFAALISAICNAAELPHFLEKPDVAIGESWTYAGYYNDRKFSIKFEIEQLSDKEIRTIVTRNGNSELAKPQTFDRQWNTIEWVDDKNRLVKFSPYLPTFDFPLHIGKTWKKNYEWQRRASREINSGSTSSPKTLKELHDQTTGDNRTLGVSRMEARVLGWEEVTVSADTYTAIKVEVLSPHYAGSENLRIFSKKENHGGVIEIYWYAPRVNRYVKYISRTYVSEKLVNSTDMELIEYKEASTASTYGKGQDQPTQAQEPQQR